MRILIFGANGAVGTALEDACRKKSIERVGLGRSDGDITDHRFVERTVDKIKPTIIVNCVAVIGIKVCEENPSGAMAVNAEAVRDLAKICEKRSIIFVQPSSHAVFDGTKESPYVESDIPRPLNVYAASKYLSEVFALNYCSKSYVVRFPTMFGPRRNSALGFVDKMLERLKKGDGIKAPSDKIDSPTYTLDAAESLLDLIVCNKPFGIYHIANAGSVSYFDLVSKMAELTNSKSTLEAVSDSFFDDGARKPLRTSMTSMILKPLRPWDEALSEYLSENRR